MGKMISWYGVDSPHTYNSNIEIKEKNMVYKEGHSSYGHCWIEGDGINFWVYVMDGRSSYGPYSSLADAISEFNRYCL